MVVDRVEDTAVEEVGVAADEANEDFASCETADKFKLLEWIFHRHFANMGVENERGIQQAEAEGSPLGGTNSLTWSVTITLILRGSIVSKYEKVVRMAYFSLHI